MKLVNFLIIFLLLLSSVSYALELPRFYGQKIVVTAARLPQPIGLSPWNVSVISGDDIDFSNAKTVGDVLRTIPGTDVRSSGYLGSAIAARLNGSTSQQVLILLNGRRINSPLLGLYDLGDILLSDVERIEIVRSPLSALYGADAVGGAINIITRKPDKKEGKIEIGLGSYATQNLAISCANKAGGIYYLTSFQYLKSDGYRDNSDYLAQNIRQNVSSGPWTLDLKYYNADKGVPGVPSNEAQPTSASTPGNRQQDLNIFADLNYTTEGKISNKFRVFATQLNQKYHQYNFIISAFEDSKYKTQQVGVELGQKLNILDKANLSYGLEYLSDSGQSGYAGDHSVNNYAAYFQQDLQGDPISLDIGARVDKHSVAGVFLSPRAGAAIALFPDLYFKASYAHAYKAPTLNDLYWNDPIWQMYGNTSLKPEKIRQLNLGLEQLSGGSRMSLNYFTSVTRDLIVWDWDPTTFITQARNLGKTKSQGIEVALHKPLNPWLKIIANYTWQRVQDLQTGLLVAYTPENKYNLTLRFFEALNISGRHVGEQYADTTNTILIPAYSLIDLKIVKAINEYELELGVDNLCDTSYYESVGYHPATYAISSYPMPGRRIFFGVRRSF